MRKRYSASFFLGEQSDPGPGLMEVSQMCLDWVVGSNHVSNPGELGFTAGTSTPRTLMGNSTMLETYRSMNENLDYWGLRLDHQDNEIEDMIWRTELCVSRDPDSEQTAFSCHNLAGSVSNLLVPIKRSNSRPRIVRDVLRKWSGYKGGFSLKAQPKILEPGNVEDFIHALVSPNRQRPVLFVSANHDDDHPVVNPKILSDWLAGLAHVVVAQNRFVSRRMEDRLPARFQCWGGAVRIYWPNISFSDPYRHKLWLPERILDIERKNELGFREYLLGFLSNVSVSIDDPEMPSWNLLDYFKRQGHIEQAKMDGNLTELIDLVDQENVRLKAENEEFQLQIWDRDERITRERAKALSWQEACIEAQKNSNKDINPIDLVLPPESVSEAIERAIELYSDRLVFSFNSKSDGEDSPFEQADEVFGAFEFLATTYYESKTGDVQCDDLDHALRNKIGWRFEANQSQAAMGKYPEWYTTQYGGNSYVLKEHFKTGNSKDPRHTVRIAFAWDSCLSRVVIGYLGQHQRTDAT